MEAAEKLTEEPNEGPEPAWLRGVEEEMQALGLPAVEPEDATLARRESMIDWWLERLAKIEADRQRNRAVASARHAMIDKWAGDQEGSLLRQVEWINGRIRELVPAADPEAFKRLFDTKGKSRSLPNGTVGFRASAEKVDVQDEEGALAFCRRHRITVGEYTLKREILAYIQSTGKNVDGVKLVPAQDTFFVKARADTE